MKFPTPEEIEAEREKINGPDAERELTAIKKKLLEQGTRNVVVDLSPHCDDAARSIIKQVLGDAGYAVDFGANQDSGGPANWVRVQRKSK